MAKKRIVTYLGPNKGLNVGKDHAFAYSGPLQISTSAVEHLAFNTGEYIVVGEITVSANIKIADIANGGITVFQIYFNGNEVLRLKVDANEEDMPTALVVPLLIPPVTAVSVTGISQYGTSAFDSCTSIIGRVHDA